MNLEPENTRLFRMGGFYEKPSLAWNVLMLDSGRTERNLLALYYSRLHNVIRNWRWLGK